jgi:hypothetical protein
LNVKKLWNECFADNNGGDHQQPSRPLAVTSTCNARFLNHSSVKSGWSHIYSSLFQIGKVCFKDFFISFHFYSSSSSSLLTN